MTKTKRRMMKLISRRRLEDKPPYRSTEFPCIGKRILRYSLSTLPVKHPAQLLHSRLTFHSPPLSGPILLRRPALLRFARCFCTACLDTPSVFAISH
jgi:hypothetical protein